MEPGRERVKVAVNQPISTCKETRGKMHQASSTMKGKRITTKLLIQKRRTHSPDKLKKHH